MIQLGARTKIYVATQPVDFRKAFRGLANLVNSSLRQDPLSGHIFVFRNRKGDSVKMICFDGVASWCFYLKFARGKLHCWPKEEQIQASQLLSLLSQGGPVATSVPFRDIA